MIRQASRLIIATAATILAVACAEGDDRDSLQRVGEGVDASKDTQELESNIAPTREGKPSPQVPAPREARLDDHGNVIADTFNVRYDLRGNQLTMTLDTDLPDETTLMASVYRAYKQTSSEEDYVVDYYSKRSTVGEWRRPQTISLNNDRWQAELDRARRILAAAGEPFSVASISDYVTISLTVPVNQSSSLFKQGNSNLRGNAVEESRFGRVIHSELEFESPLSTVSVGKACDDAFRKAASISDMQDTVEDLDPALRACSSIEEWVVAAKRHPRALDGVDPETWLRNRCEFGGPDTPLCRQVLAGE